jgi:hypothetical protein
MEAATRRALLLLLLVVSSVPAGLCQTNAQDGQSTSMIIIIRKLCFSLSIIFCWSSFLTPCSSCGFLSWQFRRSSR